MVRQLSAKHLGVLAHLHVTVDLPYMPHKVRWRCGLGLRLHLGLGHSLTLDACIYLGGMAFLETLHMGGWLHLGFLDGISIAITGTNFGTVDQAFTLLLMMNICLCVHIAALAAELTFVHRTRKALTAALVLMVLIVPLILVTMLSQYDGNYALSLFIMSQHMLHGVQNPSRCSVSHRHVFSGSSKLFVLTESQCLC